MRPYFDEKLIIMELIEVGNCKWLLKYLRKVEEKYKYNVLTTFYLYHLLIVNFFFQSGTLSS